MISFFFNLNVRETCFWCGCRCSQCGRIETISCFGCCCCCRSFRLFLNELKKKNIADRAHARIFTEKFTHGQTSKACFFFGFLMRLFLVESIVGVILSNPNPKNYTLPAIWLTMIKNRDFPLVRPSSNWYSRQANGTRNVNFTLAKNGFLVFSFSFETHLGRCSVFVCSCVWVMCGEAWN